MLVEPMFQLWAPFKVSQVVELFNQFKSSKLVIRGPEQYIPPIWTSWLWHQVAELVEGNVDFELYWLFTAPPYPEMSQGWACQRFHYTPFHTREWWQFTNHVTWVSPSLDSRGTRGRPPHQQDIWNQKRFVLVVMGTHIQLPHQKIANI